MARSAKNSTPESTPAIQEETEMTNTDEFSDADYAAIEGDLNNDPDFADAAEEFESDVNSDGPTNTNMDGGESAPVNSEGENEGEEKAAESVTVETEAPVRFPIQFRKPVRIINELAAAHNEKVSLLNQNEGSPSEKGAAFLATSTIAELVAHRDAIAEAKAHLAELEALAIEQAIALMPQPKSEEELAALRTEIKNDREKYAQRIAALGPMVDFLDELTDENGDEIPLTEFKVERIISEHIQELAGNATTQAKRNARASAEKRSYGARIGLVEINGVRAEATRIGTDGKPVSNFDGAVRYLKDKFGISTSKAEIEEMWKDAFKVSDHAAIADDSTFEMNGKAESDPKIKIRVVKAGKVK